MKFLFPNRVLTFSNILQERIDEEDDIWRVHFAPFSRYRVISQITNLELPYLKEIVKFFKRMATILNILQATTYEEVELYTVEYTNMCHDPCLLGGITENLVSGDTVARIMVAVWELTEQYIETYHQMDNADQNIVLAWIRAVETFVSAVFHHIANNVAPEEWKHYVHETGYDALELLNEAIRNFPPAQENLVVFAMTRTQVLGNICLTYTYVHLDAILDPIPRATVLASNVMRRAMEYVS